jgi:RNA polymerase sigma-70 factor (ECF subfamily)
MQLEPPTMKTTNDTDELQAKTRQPRFGRREHAFVLAVAAKLLRDRDQAEDAAQDAMLLAFRHRASFRGDSLFTSWLHRIATTTALMHLRKKAREGRHFDPTSVVDADHVTEPGLDPEQRLLVRDAVTHARRRLAELGPTYAAPVSMHFAEGYSHVEISRRLGLEPAAVKSRVYRGRNELRSELRQR